MMKRELLFKFGSSIKVNYDLLKYPISEYVLVSFKGKPVGVAFFQGRNKYCTAAIVLNTEGDEILIEHWDEWHFCETSDIKELRKIYNWAFPE